MTSGTPWADRGLERYERVTSREDSTLRDRLISEIPAGASLLDVGCGNQVLRAHHYGPYIGLDWEADLAPDVLGDSHRLPIADNAVDVAVAKNHLQHVADWRATIAEMKRVARDGVVLLEPCWSGRTVIKHRNPVRRRVFNPTEVLDELGGGSFDAPDQQSLIVFQRWF